MALLDTPEARSWLSLFKTPEEVELARVLLGSLRLVSHNSFQQELGETIERAANGLSAPIAVYAVREMEDDEAYFQDKRRSPAAAGGGSKIGSEGILADVATNLARREPKRFLNHPPVSSLKKNRCRNIFLLEDLSGSGQRVARFIRAWMQTPTLRSWWSYGLLTFHVVAYAVSNQAEEFVRDEFKSAKSKHADTHIRYWYSRRPIAGPQLWPTDLQKRLEQLCTTYGKLAKVRWEYYCGFRGSMGTLVFAHGCPNNVPGILWHGTNKDWPALFPNRTVPHSLAPVFDQAGPLLQPSGLLTLLEANSLARERVIDRLTPMGRNMVLALVALRKKVTQPDRLAMATNLPQGVCDEVVGFCLTLGLIDQNRLLTQRGINELNAVARLDRLPFEPPALDASFYFPKRLRAARG